MDLPRTPWLYATKVAGTFCLALPVVYDDVATVLTLFGALRPTRKQAVIGLPIPGRNSPSRG